MTYFGRILDTFWLPFERHFWTHIGRFLDAFMTLFGLILEDLWTSFLNALWTYFGLISNTFRTYFGHIWDAISEKSRRKNLCRAEMFRATWRPHSETLRPPCRKTIIQQQPTTQEHKKLMIKPGNTGDREKEKHIHTHTGGGVETCPAATDNPHLP